MNFFLENVSERNLIEILNNNFNLYRFEFALIRVKIFHSQQDLAQTGSQTLLGTSDFGIKRPD